MISLAIPIELNHERTVQSPDIVIGEEVEGELGETRGGVESICEEEEDEEGEDEEGTLNVN